MTNLICEHHRSPDCLRLTTGEIDVTDGDLAYVELHYECVECDLEGVYRCAGDVETTHGALVHVESNGMPIDEQRGVDQ